MRKKLLVLFAICLQLTVVTGVVAQKKPAVENQFKEKKSVMGRLVEKTVKLTGDQIGDIKDWTADKVKAAFESLTVDKPVFESAGFELSEIEIEIGLIPKIAPIFEQVEEIPEPDKMMLLASTEKKEVLNLLLKALFKFYDMKFTGYEIKSVKLSLSIPPEVELILAPPEEEVDLVAMKSIINHLVKRVNNLSKQVPELAAQGDLESLKTNVTEEDARQEKEHWKTNKRISQLTDRVDELNQQLAQRVTMDFLVEKIGEFDNSTINYKWDAKKLKDSAKKSGSPDEDETSKIYALIEKLEKGKVKYAWQNSDADSRDRSHLSNFFCD